MNNSELENKLKSVRVPERSEDYWEDFPTQVRLNLQRAAQKEVYETTAFPRFFWAGGLALALALFFVSWQFHPLQTMSVAIHQKEQHLHLMFAQLNTNIHTLMLNTHGMGYLVNEVN